MQDKLNPSQKKSIQYFASVDIGHLATEQEIVDFTKKLTCSYGVSEFEAICLYIQNSKFFRKKLSN